MDLYQNQNPVWKDLPLLLPASLFLLLACGCGSRSAVDGALTGELAHDMARLFPEGPVTVDMMDGIRMDPRYAELQAKFMIAIQKNPEWFLQYQQSKSESGKPAEYHPNLGLTKEEFEEFREILENGTGMEMVKNGVEEVTFNRRGDTLFLSGSGRLSVLDDVGIDMAGRWVQFGDVVLDEVESIDVDNDRNGLRSRWKGYSWSYTLTNKPAGLQEVQKLEDLKDLTLIIYKLVVGRLERSGRLYMEITRSGFIKGERLESVKLPFVVRK